MAPIGCSTTPKPTRKPAPVQTNESNARRTESQARVAAAEDAIRAGDKERALMEFQRAIEINPNLTTAYMGMADIYRMDHDYSNAEVRYSRAAQLEPRNFDAQFYHGLMLHLLDRVTEAIQSYLRALAVRPDDFRTNLNLATAYYQLDENQQALPYAKKAVELNPQDGPARLNLGAVYAAVGRYQDAVKEYQQAAELMELNSSLLLNLAESLGKLERYEEMANALDQAVKIGPTTAVYERLGFARFRLGNFDAAKEYFQKSLDLDADYFPAMNGLGVCLMNDWIRSDKADTAAKDRAVSLLRRSLQLDPDQPQIREILTRYGR
jgi:tetratricopeptide (TPR) repeat protein